MSAREAAAKFLLDSGGLKVSLVGEAPVEERGFCLYGLTEYLKENKVGKAIKTGLMAAVGTVMLSGALNFVEKNYQMDKIFEPPAMESVYTPPTPANDTMDKGEINDLINAEMSNVNNLKDALNRLGGDGVGDKAFVVDIENPDSIKQAEQDIKTRYAGDQAEIDSQLENLHEAVANAKNVDSPFLATVAGGTNFFAIKPSSNQVLQDLMEPLNLTEGEAKHMMQAFVDHEVQHMLVNVSANTINQAIATGEMSVNDIDSHPLSKYLTPEYKDGLKNFDFKSDISQDDHAFFKKIQKAGHTDSPEETERFNKIHSQMVENVNDVTTWSNAEMNSDKFVQFNEMLADTYGALLQVQQGNTDVIDNISKMRTNGIEQNDDQVHDTRAAMKFVSENVNSKMLEGMSPSDLSKLAAKIVNGVQYGNEHNNDNNNDNDNTNAKTLGLEIAALKAKNLNMNMDQGIEDKPHEFVVKNDMNFINKLRNGTSYDTEKNVIFTQNPRRPSFS